MTWLGVGAARPAREPKELLDQGGECAGAFGNALDRTATLLVGDVLPVGQQRRGIALHDGDRRTQFVARHGEEQVLALLDRLAPADVAEVDDGLAGVRDLRDQHLEPAAGFELVLGDDTGIGRRKRQRVSEHLGLRQPGQLVRGGIPLPHETVGVDHRHAVDAWPR